MTMIPLDIQVVIDGMAINSWTNLNAGDTGAPLAWGSYADKTVQAFGTTPAGITMEGSSDPRVATDPTNAVWATLNDAVNGGAATFTGAGAIWLAQALRWIRPNAGVGVSGATVIVTANKS